MPPRTIPSLLHLALSAILLAVLAPGALPAAAAAQPPHTAPAGSTPADPSAAPQIALGGLLAPDGGLNLPAEGIPDSIDPAGFALVSGPDEAPRFAPTAPGDENWAAGFNPPGMNYDIWALAWDGTNLYAGGRFIIAGDVFANHIARWDGEAWYTLGGGMNNFSTVLALAWDGANLYAGGNFTTAGGVVTGGFARWDGRVWHPVGDGGDAWVRALAWDGTNLYAGGSFAASIAAKGIARWDGRTWRPLGSGVNGGIGALVWDGEGLYAGGSFTAAGGKPSHRIGRWQGEPPPVTWQIYLPLVLR